MKRELYGVFVLAAATAVTDNPVALFGDADEAQRWRRANYGDSAHVIALEATVTEASLTAAREAVAAMSPAAPTAEIAPTPDPDAELRGRIRAEEVQRRREDAIRAEVAAELDARASAEPVQDASATASRRSSRAAATSQSGKAQLDPAASANTEPGTIDDQAAFDAAAARGEIQPAADFTTEVK